MSSTTLGFVHRYEPAPTGQPGPVLVLLHGTGGDENDLMPLGEMLDPEAARLSPRGKVLEGGMPRYFRRLAEGVFDIPDLKARSRELAEFLVAACDEYGLDRTQLWAVGFSNGANIAASVMLLSPGVLRGGILLSPMTPLTPDPLPDLSGTEVWIGAGRNDPIAPPEEAERLAEMLKRTGADVTVYWTQGTHGVDAREIEAARVWLEGRARS
jgi:phospholipase/carboxylesterase